MAVPLVVYFRSGPAHNLCVRGSATCLHAIKYSKDQTAGSRSREDTLDIRRPLTVHSEYL